MNAMEKTATPGNPRTTRDRLAWVLIIACALLAYFPALNGGFLWDDDGHICKSSLRSLHGLFRIWTDLGATQQYYPVLHSAFWLEWQLWGDAVLGYHLTNLLLHATAACLVVALVRRLALPGAWLAGLIFALHPICVESVAWISEQKNTLSAVFALGAVLLYLRFDETRLRRHYAVASLLFLLALLTKSVTAMLPIVLLVIFWWQRDRLRWREDILPLVPWLVIGAGAGLFTAWVERNYIGAEGADFTLTPGQRVLLAGRIAWFYLWKLVWPANLIFIYPRWTPNTAVVWQWLFPVALAILLLALWLVRKHNRAPLAALLAYLALLFPALGFINVYPFIFSFVADHFQYLASLAIIVPASALFARFAQRLPARWPAPLGAVLLITLLGAQTWRQSHLYRNAETLYRDIIARNPGCWLAYNNLGNVLDTLPERHDEIIVLYRTALRLNPDNSEPHVNLASVLSRHPETMLEAIEHWEFTLRAKPHFADGHNNLGVLLTRVPNRLPEAIVHFETAVRLQPDFTSAHNNLGTALARLPDRLPEAIHHYRIALKVAPDFAETYFNLANALAKSPDTHAEAITRYEEAIRLQPRYAEAHVNLAVLLSQNPTRRADAIAHYEAALHERPELENVRRALERLRADRP